MSDNVTYYNYPDTNVPHVVLAMMESIRYFICNNLYSLESYEDAKKRFIKANFEVGTEHAVRGSIGEFLNVSGGFPFTAYNIGEFDPSEDKTNLYEKSGLYYSDYFGKYVQSIPLYYTINMLTIFNTPSDYHRGQATLFAMNGRLQRFIVPVTINGVLDAFNIDLKMDITRGNFDYQTIEQESYGDLYDIRHDVKVYMHYYYIPNTTVYPVDDIEVSLKTLDSEDKSLSILDTFFNIPDTPLIESTTPSDGDNDISVDLSVTSIEINFNIEMDESSVEDSLTIDPFVPYETNWGIDSKQIILTLNENLQNDTLYEITLTSESKSIYNTELEDDFTFSFTTVA